MRNFSFAGNLNKVWMLALVAFMVACSQFEAQGPDDVNLESSEDVAALIGTTAGMWNAREDCSGPYDVVLESVTNNGDGTYSWLWSIQNPNPGNGSDGTVQDLSHWTFDPGLCLIADNIVSAAYSNDGEIFNEILELGFNKDPSNDAWSFGKDLFKFDFGTSGSDKTYYSLTVDKNFKVDPNAVGYYKSGGTTGCGEFCFEGIGCPDDEQCFEWEGETAWSAGTRYVTRGNWATYSSKSDLEAGVTLFAGQNMDAGTVKLTGGVITIKLNDGWRFAETDENVKIQHYSDTPLAENPNPGGFYTKGTATESPFSIEVKDGAYYGVHVDVEEYREVECEIVE